MGASSIAFKDITPLFHYSSSQFLLRCACALLRASQYFVKMVQY